jgi:protein disulfide-isomerase A1
MDPKENAGAMGFFGADADKLPSLLIHDPKNDGKFNSGVIEISKMKAYVSDFKAGKLEKTVKSEEPPADNSGPVKVVVAKNFKEIVFSGKNVLIEFYAPWCGHCKNLEPIYKELGEAYKSEDKVVIAKMDATANDVEDKKFNVKGFPTIMFVSDKGEVKNYEGGRTLEDFKAFIDKEVGLKSGKDTKEEKKEDKKQDEKEDKKKEDKKKEDKKKEKEDKKTDEKKDKKKEDKKDEL